MSDTNIQHRASKAHPEWNQALPLGGDTFLSDSQLKKWVKKKTIRRTLTNKTSPDLIRISTHRNKIQKHLCKISVPDYVDQIICVTQRSTDQAAGCKLSMSGDFYTKIMNEPALMCSFNLCFSDFMLKITSTPVVGTLQTFE